MTEKEIVKFQAWDLDTDDIIEVEMDADDYRDMCEAEDKAEKEKEERRKERRRQEYESWYASRNREE
jgi:hypothetical protein